MFPHQKKKEGGKKEERKECKNAVMEVFNQITEVKNAGGAHQNRNQITSWLKKETFSGKLSLILSFSMKLKSGSI